MSSRLLEPGDPAGKGRAVYGWGRPVATGRVAFWLGPLRPWPV